MEISQKFHGKEQGSSKGSPKKNAHLREQVGRVDDNFLGENKSEEHRLNLSGARTHVRNITEPMGLGLDVRRA